MSLLLFPLIGLVWFLGVSISIYGVYISFTNKWYFGVLSLLVPGIAFIAGLFKLFAKKDLWKE